MTSPQAAILAVLARYVHLIDDGRRSELDTVFTADARLHLFGETVDGLGPLTDALGGDRPATGRRHMNYNVEITITANTVTALSDWCLMAPDGTDGWRAVSMGRYEDRLIETTNGWRIAERWIR